MVVHGPDIKYVIKVYSESVEEYLYIGCFRNDWLVLTKILKLISSLISAGGPKIEEDEEPEPPEPFEWTED